jgi:hypothetical protein
MRQSRARNGVGEVVFPTDLTAEYDGFKGARWIQRGAAAVRPDLPPVPGFWYPVLETHDCPA